MLNWKRSLRDLFFVLTTSLVDIWSCITHPCNLRKGNNTNIVVNGISRSPRLTRNLLSCISGNVCLTPDRCKFLCQATTSVSPPGDIAQNHWKLPFWMALEREKTVCSQDDAEILQLNGMCVYPLQLFDFCGFGVSAQIGSWGGPGRP